MVTTNESRVFRFLGGDLSLDFINTYSGPRGDGADYLKTYDSLLEWGKQSGILDQAKLERLLRTARSQPLAAQAALSKAVAFREVLYEVLAALLHGHAPPPTTSHMFNVFLAEAMPHLRMNFAPHNCFWEWVESDCLDFPWWPVAREASLLLLSGKADRLRECANEDCRWFYLDTSKNRSRKWCSMEICGNSAKVRRHRERKEAQKARP